MRTTARRALTIALTATVVCNVFGGTALAVPLSLDAPSALVLTSGRGDTVAVTTPERAVVLSCHPTPAGTHPLAAEACAELLRTGGDFDAVHVHGNRVCTREYRPVTVTATGVWQGKRVAYERTYSNACTKSAYVTSVFAF